MKSIRNFANDYSALIAFSTLRVVVRYLSFIVYHLSFRIALERINEPRTKIVGRTVYGRNR